MTSLEFVNEDGANCNTTQLLVVYEEWFPDAFSSSLLKITLSKSSDMSVKLPVSFSCCF